MYLGFLVPGVVTTRIGALSSPASMALRMAAQNASSARFARLVWISCSSLIPGWKVAVMKGKKEGISWPTRGSAQGRPALSHSDALFLMVAKTCVASALWLPLAASMATPAMTSAKVMKPIAIMLVAMPPLVYRKGHPDSRDQQCE